jgi:hypothetical protein
MRSASPARPASRATNLHSEQRHHSAFRQGALIHLGAVIVARFVEQEFEIKDPLIRTLTYSALVAGAGYFTHLLRDNDREREHRGSVAPSVSLCCEHVGPDIERRDAEAVGNTVLTLS